MNHFDEMMCLLYLEGQLDPLRAREVTMHAGECAQCRALLHALERESDVLAAALTEEDEPMPRDCSARAVGACHRGAGPSPLDFSLQVGTGCGATRLLHGSIN